jgi:HEAT repeat protein
VLACATSSFGLKERSCVRHGRLLFCSPLRAMACAHVTSGPSEPACVSTRAMVQCGHCECYTPMSRTRRRVRGEGHWDTHTHRSFGGVSARGVGGCSSSTGREREDSSTPLTNIRPARCTARRAALLVAAFCAPVVHGFCTPACPVVRSGSVHRPGLACSPRAPGVLMLAEKPADGETKNARRGAQRALDDKATRLFAAPVYGKQPGDEAVEKIVEATRKLGIVSKQKVQEQRDDVDEAGLAVVAEWALWLNENCPSDLTSTLAGLTDERASQRKAAVTRLLKGVSPEGKSVALPAAASNWAFAALAARLGDNSAAVRQAAVKGLASISEKGNRNVVLAMASLIEEEKAITVRTAALQALSRVAQRGDQEALAPVLNLLRTVEGAERGDVYTPKLSLEVKRKAVKALGTLAERDSEVAIKTLVRRILDDPSPQVREAAIRGLASVASPSHAQVMWALGVGCEDADEGVRRLAVKSLHLLLDRQEAKQVLHMPASTVPPAHAVALEEDGDARVYWHLPGVWEA